MAVNREQARRLIAAADRLPEKIGTNSVLYGDKPCCAIGHLVCADGYAPTRSKSLLDVYAECQKRFGIDETELFTVNDNAFDETRRAAVIAEIERQIREAGHNPDALRAEVADNA